MVTITYDEKTQVNETPIEYKKSTLYEGIFKNIKSITEEAKNKFTEEARNKFTEEARNKFTEEARNKLNDVKSVISQVFNRFRKEEVFSSPDASSTDAYQIRNSELSSFEEEELTLEKDEVNPKEPYTEKVYSNYENRRIFEPYKKVPIELIYGNNTIDIDAVFDTGCAASIINSSILKAYNIKPKPIKGVTITNASGKVMPLDGEIELGIKLGQIGRAHV